MRRFLPDLSLIGLFFLLPLILFWSQTIGGKTLLPTENLYQYEPYATYREVVSAPEIPHNHLISDLVLQNYQWKSFTRQSIASREIPLWNPHQFSGIPFLAAGQQSTFYPLSLVYYVMPLPVAYGWFTVLNLWLAGVMMYLFIRGLGLARFGAAIAAVTYQLCGFFVASVVFPMIIGGVVWMPLLLLMAEFIIRRQSFLGQGAIMPWVVIGAVGLACQIFAGHVEVTIYTLLILAYYAAFRLVWAFMMSRRGDATHRPSPIQSVVFPGLWLSLMVVLGLGLASLQFIPLFEFVQTNWRAERSDLNTVLGFAHPFRDVIQFVLPNFYGNPAHHSYYDLFSQQTVQATDVLDRPFIDWGIKNYVEGALYLGILPLALAIFGVVSAWLSSNHAEKSEKTPPYRLIFVLLVLISLSFMFGLPTYAVIYILPGINQLNSPFRWIFGVTVGIAVLAGFGADTLVKMGYEAARRWARRFAYVLFALGTLILAGLLVSRVIFNQIEPLLQRIVDGAALANLAFADARMFYSYQFPNVLVFAIMTLGAGGVFWLFTQGKKVPLHEGEGLRERAHAWQIFAIGLLAIDLMIASWGFNAASDPLLLDFTPPAVAWLLERQQEEPPFRYTTLEDPNAHAPILNANMTMRYGLDDIRGYDSIISEQYVAYMRDLTIQPQLDFNRIAPLYMDRLDEIDWGLLSLLNVRYILTHKSVTLPENLTTASDPRRFPAQFELAFDGDAAVNIWRVGGVDRAYLVETESIISSAAQSGAVPTTSFGVTITSDTGREKFVDVDLTGVATQWLVISETYAPGWRAYVRPQGLGDGYENELDVQRYRENFQAVRVAPDELADLYADDLDSEDAALMHAAIQAGRYTVRLVYSPTSFQVGVFGTVISAALVMFLVGVWVWRFLVGDSGDDDETVSRVARNSLVPIVLNLFNRGIDFAFAFVMLRILGPEDAGIYYYAIVVFVWFDIFTNFGLDVYLMREVSRHREQSGRYFFNTSIFRLFLMVACVPLLLGFLLIRQSTVEPALDQSALLAIGLLYIGLAPGSLSKGMTSLFYAFEKAEIPAAVTTITTINKAVLGLIALLLGYGIIGLAGVSIFVNVITLFILIWVGRGLMSRAQGQNPYTPDRSLWSEMRREGWPLMLNHFLATIFFQIDIVILEMLRGAAIVGKYSVSYRWLLALNIIPAFFTQALFPVMSRQAREDRAALKRTYTLGVKLLVGLALPLAVVFTFLAETLTLILGGAEFMPEGAIALQIMIWSIPIGWMNSLTQYALIAVDLQRRITTAFAIAVSFNIITNLIFIPQFGYQAAAVTTILSEAVLLLPFGVLLSGALGRIDWVDMVWRPVVAVVMMFAVMVAVWPIEPFLALVGGGVAYLVVLIALRPLSSEEMTMLSPVIPAPLKRFVPVQSGV